METPKTKKGFYHLFSTHVKPRKSKIMEYYKEWIMNVALKLLLEGKQNYKYIS